MNEDNKNKTKKKKRQRVIRKKKSLLTRVIHQPNPPILPLHILQIIGAFFLTLLIYIGIFIRNFIIMYLILAFIAGCIILVRFVPILHNYDAYAEKIVSESDRSDFQIDLASTIYDNNGDTIAILHKDAVLNYIPYDEIPENVVNAFIAVEDRTFWTNSGVNYKGIVRVLKDFITTHGAEVHGASTITQQLTRMVYLSSEVSMQRKLKEIMISRRLTEKYSKKDIMEFYVNCICYGTNIYGIGGAANAYFSKDVDELTLSEIAYLCAIPNRPSYYNPYKYPERALERRDKILNDMESCGFITATEREEAQKEVIKINPPETPFYNYETSYAIDCAIKYFMKNDGFEFQYAFNSDDEYNQYHNRYNKLYEKERDKLYTGGYRIYTSLDHDAYLKLQDIIDKEMAFNESVDEKTGIYELQSALTCIDNSTGNVVAVVGGRSQDTLSNNAIYTFNRAYQTYRQPGSSIKPIVVYTPAIQKGYNPDTIVENIDVTKAKEKGANPKNMHGAALPLRNAVEKSLNGVAFKVFDDIGQHYGMSFAEEMEYSNLCPHDYYTVAALGGLTYGTTTVEQASGYATLANHGIFRTPTCITSITDREGNELYRGYTEKQVYENDSAYTMLDILRGVLTRGTAAQLNWSSVSNIDAFAKTGTTNNSKDGWLCGATPYYTIAVWVGYDQPKELSNLYGATYPGQIWKKAMLAMTENLPSRRFHKNDKTDNDDNIDDSDNDESNTENEGGYYSYYPGYDDDYVLAPNYTVKNYREDRVIGESIHAVLEQMESLDMSLPESNEELEDLYSEAQEIKNTILSRKYTTQMSQEIENIYQNKKQDIRN